MFITAIAHLTAELARLAHEKDLAARTHLYTS
jgi:hypothetical protein